MKKEYSLEIYKEHLELVIADKDYHLEQIRIHKEAIKERNLDIKRREAKIKELEAR